MEGLSETIAERDAAHAKYLQVREARDAALRTKQEEWLELDAQIEALKSRYKPYRDAHAALAAETKTVWREYRRLDSQLSGKQATKPFSELSELDRSPSVWREKIRRDLVTLEDVPDEIRAEVEAIL